MAGAGRLAELSASVRERFEARRRAAGASEGIVVAVSGGADSAVCLWAAAATGLAVRAVFVDHGFAESAAMEAAAQAVAAACAVPLEVARVEVAAGPSPEAQARSARQAALEEACGDGWLMTGHTADDQAETVLGNLLRGAGAEGLGGIPARRGPWLRPLLDVSRAETRELATLLGLPFVDDPANEAREPRRNVIRREVIPDLESRFNPDLRSVLRRTADLLRSDDEVLERASAAVPQRLEGDTVRLPAPLLATLPVPIATRAIRAALRAVRGPHAGTEREVTEVLAVARAERGSLVLAGGFAAAREGPWLTVHPGRTVPPWEPAELRIPGSLGLPQISVDAWIEERPPSPWPLGRATLVVDADAVADTLVIGPAAPADRIALASGSKAAGDALAEAGVPARMRPGWPMVASGERLVWLVGVRAAHWARPGPETRRYAWLTARLREVR